MDGVSLMRCLGVWIMGPSGEVVASTPLPDGLVGRLRYEAAQAFSTGSVCDVALDPNQRAYLFPVTSSQFSGVVGVCNEREDMAYLTTAAIAHDINNLLAVAQGHLELMQRSLDPASRSLDEALWVLERTAVLVRRLYGSLPFDGPTTRVHETLEHLCMHLNDGRHCIKWDIEPVPDVAMTQSDFIEVFQNLITNARDAMLEGGPIAIGLHAAGDGVGISITDTGIGMDEETLSHFFKPLFTTKAYGHGLGLYRIQQLIKQCRGRIAVDSRPGGGTTITVWLPRA